jgi:hypothetical protein
MVQLHKKFQDNEVKELLKRYIEKIIYAYALDGTKNSIFPTTEALFLPIVYTLTDDAKCRQVHKHKIIKRKHVQEILGISRSRFFELLDEYRNNPVSFSIQYERTLKTRTLPLEIEKTS